MAPTNEQIHQTPLDVEYASEKPLFKNGDKALEFLRTEAEVGEADDVDEKRLVRKIDFMIVPLMFLCYLLQYLDKSLREYIPIFQEKLCTD